MTTPLVNTIVDCNVKLSKKLSEIGEKNLLCLRNRYKKSNSQQSEFDQESRFCLEVLKNCEREVFETYKLEIKKLARAFYNTTHVDRYYFGIEDYVQECMFGMYDAMYTFDGSVEFMTYANSVMINKLRVMLRDSEQHSGVGREIKVFRKKIKNKMSECNIGSDHAIQVLLDQGEINSEDIPKIRASLYEVKTIGGYDVSDNSYSPDNEGIKIMREAVKAADLTPVQRYMVEYFLDTGKRPDSIMIYQINPRTNNLYTRAALSQQWVTAMEKIKQFAKAAA